MLKAVFLLGALAFGSTAISAQATPRVYELRPAAGVRPSGFDAPSYALLDPAGPAEAPLVVFLAGTGGKPRNAAELLGVIVGQGYRAVGLEYDDEPAVSQVCPKDPDPNCSETFREMRVDGTGPARAVRNPPEEAVIPRLVTLLRRLEVNNPGEGWGAYLDGDQPRWSRIAVSGLSQGAGMAAYIAKHHPVARVVLFSSPWDVTGVDHHPAPWLSAPSATPPERWFAEYHRREVTAGLIRNAYAALKIPQDHILVFDHDLPGGRRYLSDNPFHGMTIKDVSYTPQWREMFGRADAP